MKYYIKTFGCQMNISDSERIAGFLEARGIRPAKDIMKSDFVVFNTCGVRQAAENRVYGQIHNLSMINEQRSKNNKITVILTGCLAKRKDVKRRLKDKVDLFLSINELERFENVIIKNYLKITRLPARQENLKLKIPAQRNAMVRNDYLSIKPKYINKKSAYVPIMTGCNNFCSYCVVPHARGREISRPADEIIKEVKSLVKKGYKEIVLLGQNVNSYHGTYNMEHGTKNTNFSQLLRAINDIPGDFWLWFVSNHPKDFSSELIETMTKYQKVLECVHLPLQAGDDKVLQNMNRKYTAKKYLALIGKIKKAYAKNKPGKIYSITSDIIIGFPDETKRQFLESAQIMEKVRYDMVYFGQFSPRPGTAAWKMKDSVTKKEKERREKYLNEILKKTSYQNNQKYLKKIVEVLVEKEKAGSYFGHTRTMKKVKFSAKKKGLVGQIIEVKITEANTWSLGGKAI